MFIAVRSKIGRSVLTALGIVYFAAALTVLVYYVSTNWGANGLTDYILQLALGCAALGGVVLFLIGSDEFSLRHMRQKAQSPATS